MNDDAARYAREGIPATGFEEAYRGGDAPWDIGRPQPDVLRFLADGWLRGRVLDIGCGTGDNALFLASRGLEVLGVDAVPLAIERALAKAGDGTRVRFRAADALALEALGEAPFDAALDCGLFHVFSDTDRPRYVAGLHALLRPGGHLCLLCFSDAETRPDGPRRVTRAELDAAFGAGFEEVALRPTRFESRLHEGGAQAWAAVYRRSG